jgi:hypothetical protein
MLFVVARDCVPLNLETVLLITQKVYHPKMMDVNEVIIKHIKGIGNTCVSGFVGILLSPAHLCLFLTLDYFRADIRETYKILVWPALVIFLAAFLVLLFLRII